MRTKSLAKALTFLQIFIFKMLRDENPWEDHMIKEMYFRKWSTKTETIIEEITISCTPKMM